MTEFAERYRGLFADYCCCEESPTALPGQPPEGDGVHSPSALVLQNGSRRLAVSFFIGMEKPP